MTVPPLPEAFVRRIREQLGRDAEAYFAAMEQPPLRGLRLNPAKPSASLPEGVGEPVPWAPGGRYLSLESGAGLHPLHDAGAYYLQEPSAMLPAALLAPRPGERVLDLCAAPGGKATQLAAAMAGRGTLICNEIVPSRATVLSRNLERMGATHAAAVCADPARLSEAWPLWFDAVLADAPCSGEGMFRRRPGTRLEWDADAPARCAVRQLKILESACRMLRPGGRLCYSTCTLNRTENEGVIGAFLSMHPEFEPMAYVVPAGAERSIESENGCARLLPHEAAGEGHFAALLLKTARGAGDAPMAPSAGAALSAPDQSAVESFRIFWREVSTADAPLPNAVWGSTLLRVPELPPLRGINVLRAGLRLGEPKGKAFAPDHALAVAAPPPPVRTVALTLPQADAYRRGETLPAPEGLRGWYAATVEGVPAGFVKASDGMLKNHYPKGLRRPAAGLAESGGRTDGDD